MPCYFFFKQNRRAQISEESEFKIRKKTRTESYRRMRRRARRARRCSATRRQAQRGSGRDCCGLVWVANEERCCCGWLWVARWFLESGAWWAVAMVALVGERGRKGRLADWGNGEESGLGLGLVNGLMSTPFFFFFFLKPKRRRLASEFPNH
ncbi:hypothetical protein HN873_022114 [Arachis hypogaea]